MNKYQKGFTLLEILLVIAAIGILAAIVLIAINPNRQLAQARNAERRSEISVIYKSLEQFLIDNGNYPTGITTTLQSICETGSETATNPITNCTGTVDLRVLVPTYLAEIPTDPSGGPYEVMINSTDNRVSVQASQAELEQVIAINLGAVSDPEFANVSLLLDFEGTNGSTTFVDDSNQSHIPIAYDGMEIRTAQSRFGSSSGYITNSNSYLSVASNPSLQIGNTDYTIELFIYLTSGSSGGMVITKGSPYVSSEFALMRYFGDDLRYYPTNSVGTTFTGAAVGQSNLQPNTWYHVAISREGNTHRFFIDGVLQTTVNATPTAITNDPLLIGYSPWVGTGWGAPAGIYLDDLRITKNIARYTSNFTPPTETFPKN